MLDGIVVKTIGYSRPRKKCASAEKYIGLIAAGGIGPTLAGLVTFYAHYAHNHSRSVITCGKSDRGILSIHLAY